jgi:hypothetical protein
MHPSAAHIKCKYTTMATQVSLEPYLLLELMLQQPSLLGDDDSWNGSTSNARRRKLQNRVNQRAHREFSTFFVPIIL